MADRQEDRVLTTIETFTTDHLSPDQLIAALKQMKKAYSDEYTDLMLVTGTCEHDYSSAEIELQGYRKMTDAERKRKEDDERRARELSEKLERAQYEELKKKYG